MPDQSVISPEGRPTSAGPRKTRILAVVNQKGGVGKTTTAINLGTALAAVGRRVLILDLDPQGNASTGFGIPHGRRRVGTYELLIGTATLAAATQKTDVPDLSIIPATPTLSGAEVELVSQMGREFRLRDTLHDALRGDAQGYDYVLIDCPPALGLLTVNALVASDGVLVPLQAEFLALEGLSQLLRTVELVRQRLNPALKIQGVVLTMVDRRNRLCEAVCDDVRRHLGAQVYRTEIPRNVRVSEAPSHGKPVLLYDLRSAGAQAYVRLASEFLKREEPRGDDPAKTEVAA